MIQQSKTPGALQASVAPDAAPPPGAAAAGPDDPQGPADHSITPVGEGVPGESGRRSDSPGTHPTSYYTRLATSLREVADRIATLADRDDMPARLWISSLFLAVSYDESQAASTVPVVDTFAELLEGKTGTEKSRYASRYKATGRIGYLKYTVNTAIPEPEPKRTSTAKLRAENERLRAELARLGHQDAEQ